MLAFQFILAIIGATVAFAHNTMTFISNDNEDRILSFTCNPGFEEFEEVPLPGRGVHRHQFPEAWIGTAMARKHGAVHPIHRVIAEIAWAPNDWVYYDISAVDNHTDNEGIRYMFPIGAPDTDYYHPGCDRFPCRNAYLLPDDPHTRTTDITDFIVEIGTKG